MASNEKGSSRLLAVFQFLMILFLFVKEFLIEPSLSNLVDLTTKTTAAAAAGPPVTDTRTATSSNQAQDQRSCLDRPAALIEDRRKLYEYVKECAKIDGLWPINTIAEVGVQLGGNAKVLWEVLEPPTKFHMIDLWGETSDSRFRASNEQLVKDKFAKQIEAGVAETHKMDSRTWMEQQPDNSLDMLYLDTQHTYVTTKTEIERTDRVMKEHSYLCGHDFGHPERKSYGVIEAVVDFALYNNWQFIAFSLDNVPYRSFCMQRRRPNTLVNSTFAG